MWKYLVLSVLAAGLFLARPAPALACACCGTWKVVNVAAHDSLNVRTGPGVGYSKIGAIPSGSACVLKSSECKGKWCRVAYGELIGWVNTGYLRFFNSP